MSMKDGAAILKVLSVQLIEEHLDVGPTMDRQVLKKHLPSWTGVLRDNFFEVWALLRHKVPLCLSIEANTPELILPCCPNGKPQIRSQ